MINIATLLRYIKLDMPTDKVYNGYMSIDEMTLREEIARSIEAIEIKDSITNALGMRMLAANVARGESNYMTSMFESQVDFE